MSARSKTPLGRVLDAFSLAVVFGILYFAVRAAPGLRGDAGIFGAIGFLLLAGTLMSELLEVIRLPHLTGYLVAGLIAGPHVLGLIDTDSVKRLAPVNTLALALIALGGGAELRVDQVRRGLKSLVVATIIQTLVVGIAVAGIFVLAHPVIPFAQRLPMSAVLAAGLLFGVVATTRSPSATLGILAQTRARGPLASFALAFVMTSDVVVIVALACGIMVAHVMLEPSATLSFAAFRTLGHEILGSVSLGTTLGVVLAAYLRFIGRQLLVVLVAIGFGATEVLRYLQFDPLLTFVVAGFVVQNLSKQGDRFLHAIEGMGGVVYVLFFAIAGADLDVPLLKELWPAALLLAASRAAITFGAARLSGAIARDPPVLKRWAWTSLVAQAGLTQGLANVVQREFPVFGDPFRALVFANVALNAIVGPVLFKLALDRSKESKGPAPALSEVEEPADAK